MVTDLESAELIKYASNVFLATKISFINEMSMLCEKVGADVHAVAKGMGLDGRIGKKFLHPGPGFGGSCFPKDTQALIRMAQEQQVSTRIVEAVLEVNVAEKARMVAKIRQALGGVSQARSLSCWASLLNPTQTTCAMRPVSRFCPRCSIKAPGSGPMTLRGWWPPPRCYLTVSLTMVIFMRLLRAVMRWS